MRGINRTWKNKMSTKFQLKNFKTRYRFGDQGGDGYVILLHKYDCDDLKWIELPQVVVSEDCEQLLGST
jgi:hypothetical protein